MFFISVEQLAYTSTLSTNAFQVCQPREDRGWNAVCNTGKVLSDQRILLFCDTSFLARLIAVSLKSWEPTITVAYWEQQLPAQQSGSERNFHHITWLGGHWTIRPILIQIREMCQSMQVQFIYTSRQNNQEADHLAKKALKIHYSTKERNCCNSCPQHSCPILTALCN